MFKQREKKTEMSDEVKETAETPEYITKADVKSLLDELRAEWKAENAPAEDAKTPPQAKDAPAADEEPPPQTGTDAPAETLTKADVEEVVKAQMKAWRPARGTRLQAADENPLTGLTGEDLKAAVFDEKTTNEQILEYMRG